MSEDSESEVVASESSDSEPEVKRKSKRKRRRRDCDEDNNSTPETKKAADFRIKIPRQSILAQEQAEQTDYEDLFKTERGLFKLFICARSLSGKTTLLYNLMRKTVDNKTKVIIYAANYMFDPVWEAIMELMEKKGIHYTIKGAWKPAQKSAKFNMLKDFFDKTHNPDVDVDNSKRDKFLLISDDQGQWNRDEHLEKILKNYRHMNCSVIVVSQSVTDINPNCWAEFDATHLFAAQPEYRLKELWKKMALTIDFEEFLQLYNHATREPFCFFYVAGRGLEDYRKNYTDRYIVKTGKK